MLLAGERDVEAGAVSFRFGDRTQVNGVPRDDAVDAIVDWIARRENAAPTAELVEVATSRREQIRTAQSDDDRRPRRRRARPVCSGCGRRTG